LNLPAALVGKTAADRAMANLASAYWVGFGKTGNPNGGGRTEWLRHDAGADRIMDFTNKGVVLGLDPLKPRLDLWEKVWSENP